VNRKSKTFLDIFSIVILAVMVAIPNTSYGAESNIKINSKKEMLTRSINVFSMLSFKRYRADYMILPGILIISREWVIAPRGI